MNSFRKIEQYFSICKYFTKLKIIINIQENGTDNQSDCMIWSKGEKHGIPTHIVFVDI